MTDLQLAAANDISRNASYLGLILAIVGLVSGLVRSFGGWPLYLIVGGVLGFVVMQPVSVQFQNRLKVRNGQR